jgi:ketosteroid isomerase-like protein
MDFEADQIAEVLDVERSWVAAHRSLDLDIIKSILSEENRQIQSDGTVIGKDELLDSYRSGVRRWDIAESDEHEVRMLDDVALMIGRWRGVGENNGEEFNYTARFLAVYHREGRV